MMKNTIDPSDYDAVLFDLDGTLVESMGMWRKIDEEFLAMYGYDVPPGLQKRIEGLTWSQTERFFRDEFAIPLECEEIGNIWLEMAKEKYRNETPAKKGAVDFIKELRAKGIPMAISSSNHAELITEALDAHGIRDCFDAVSTCEEAGAPKPEPDVYLLSAKKLGADPARCLVFEDIVHGIMAAKAAGMTVIAVDDGDSRGSIEEKRRLADGMIKDYTAFM